MIPVVLLVIGGASGAGLRWWLTRTDEAVPWRMMALNVAASAVAAALVDLDGQWRWLLNVGVLGALSTWSSLAVAGAELGRKGEVSTALAVVVGTAAASIAAAAVVLAV